MPTKDSTDWLRFRAEHYDRVFYGIQNGYIQGNLEDVLWEAYLHHKAKQESAS